MNAFFYRLKNPPIRGQAWTLYTAVTSQANTKIHQDNPTLAVGDVKISKDGGALANVETLPVPIGTSAILALSLSAAEMTADVVVVQLRDVAGDEWCDNVFSFNTYESVDVSTFDPELDGVVVSENSDKTGYYLQDTPPTADLIVASLFDTSIESNMTFVQALRIVLAVLAGKSTGGGTNTISFRDATDAKDRVVATVDANGNRSSVITDGYLPDA